MILAMIIAMVTMIGLTSAVTTDVIYNGDGLYNMYFNGDGTGYCGVHTYTSNGEDYLQTEWTNAVASGWQKMKVSEYNRSNAGTYEGNSGITTYNYTGLRVSTDINRSITIGGVDDNKNASGSILTFTDDNNGNTLFTIATCKSIISQISNVTTDQKISIYRGWYNATYDYNRNNIIGHREYSNNGTGVVGSTDISGFAYEDDTLITGYVKSTAGDSYTIAFVEMTEGEFDMNVYSSSYTGKYSGEGWMAYDWHEGDDVSEFEYTANRTRAYSRTNVDADGIGIFVLGAGTDAFSVYANMKDEVGDLSIRMYGTDGNTTFLTPFNGAFNGYGWVYAIDLPEPTPVES